MKKRRLLGAVARICEIWSFEYVGRRSHPLRKNADLQIRIVLDSRRERHREAVNDIKSNCKVL
jgi:hypothetical protein